MCETWFIAITQPPSAGIFSPSIHSCFVAVSNVGFTMATATPQAHPRRSFSLRTLTTTTPSTCSADRAGADYRRGCEDLRCDGIRLCTVDPGQGRADGEIASRHR